MQLETLELTEEENDVLMHTVGLNYKPKQKEYFRNRFLAGEGHHDMPTLTSLVEKGLMAHGKTLTNGDVWYWLSEDGLKYIQRFNKYKPKKGYVIESL